MLWKLPKRSDFHTVSPQGLPYRQPLFFAAPQRGKRHALPFGEGQTVEKASGAVAPKPSPGGEGAPVRTLGRMWCAVQCCALFGTSGEFVTFHAASRLHHISHKSTLTSQFVPASPRGEAFFSKNRTFLTHSPHGEAASPWGFLYLHLPILLIMVYNILSNPLDNTIS